MRSGGRNKSGRGFSLRPRTQSQRPEEAVKKRKVPKAKPTVGIGRNEQNKLEICIRGNLCEAAGMTGRQTEAMAVGQSIKNKR
jgi:hypothetical protein